MTLIRPADAPKTILIVIGTRTVESFRATLMDKLGVRTASAAVRIALLAGLPGLSEAPVSAD
ncbi:MAG: hypothetical protein ACKOAN_10350 [Chakrabartia sp.]